MKLKALAAAALGLFSLSSQAINDQTFQWYTSAAGNNMVVTTTVGCLNATTMYERHRIHANHYDGKWHYSDYDFNFYLYANGEYNAHTYMNSFNTDNLHYDDGTVIPVGFALEHYRPYKPLVGMKSKIGDPNSGAWTVSGAYFPVDVKCNQLLQPKPWPPKLPPGEDPWL